METKLCCVLAITIVGVAGNARGNHGNVLANTEQRHGNMQHLRSSARFVTVKRNTGSYDDNKQENPVDLHNKEFCVDVSAFKPLEWVEKEGEECKTEFVKNCEEKRQNVCAEVVETRCEVIPYTECSLGMEEQGYTETELAPKLFVEQTCSQGTRTVPHIKMVPECKNVTKQNCVTLWERDAEGNQVWAGKEGCEPVTWQECKLVPKEVKFIVPEITCVDKQELWYHEPELRNFTQMTSTFTCQVKNTTHCTSKPRSDCKYLKWEECRFEPISTCEPKLVHVPMQEKVHRKKCLLPDNEIKPSYGPPSAPVKQEAPKYTPTTQAPQKYQQQQQPKPQPPRYQQQQPQPPRYQQQQQQTYSG